MPLPFFLFSVVNGYQDSIFFSFAFIQFLHKNKNTQRVVILFYQWGKSVFSTCAFLYPSIFFLQYNLIILLFQM